MLRKAMSFVLAAIMVFGVAVTCSAAGAPPGGVYGGSITFEADLRVDAQFTADDVPWIIEQARTIGETDYGFVWSDWKDPNNSYYLGGYNTTVDTLGRTKEQVVEGIRDYYFETYKALGDVRYFYIELKSFDDVEYGGSSADYGPGHYWVYVYRG